VRADLVSNIVQPAASPRSNRVSLLHRERRPNGLLAGLLMDDRRDPTVRVTIVAELGEMVRKRKRQLPAAAKRQHSAVRGRSKRPGIVVFDRYAFDLSQFGGTPRHQYSVRERYLWQLISPDTEDRSTRKSRDNSAPSSTNACSRRSTVCLRPDRLRVPGAPRTTRQSAAWSLGAVILSVAFLRLIGSPARCSPSNIRSPRWSVHGGVGAMAASLYAISSGLIIEPPAVCPGPSAPSADGSSAAPVRSRSGAMISTLQKYFGMRFLHHAGCRVLGVFALIILLDYRRAMRRLGDDPKVSAAAIAKIRCFACRRLGERILPSAC